MDDLPLFSKVANALIDKVEPRPDLLWAMNYQTLGFAGWMLRKFHRRYGGLWVGGRITLYRDRLGFAPNWLNRQVQVGDLAMEYPLTALVSVTRQFGLFTGIVDVDFGEKRLIFRCYGADKAADEIRAAALAAR
ncbi:MAG TPA: hypothetical protein VJ753_00170 [Rhizomicrobium sp.]|nr:hypothetical protein [Rhizomicrobium sp.]